MPTKSTKSTKSTKEKEAEILYNYYLNRLVYPLIGTKTTYQGELNKAGRQLLGIKFKGVFASNKIPRLNDLAPYCILNLDKSSETGSHWISLAKFPHSNKTAIYDSFGRDYKRIIPNLSLSGNGRIINTDKDAEQEILESDCGARCLSWLLLVDNYGYKTALLI